MSGAPPAAIGEVLDGYRLDRIIGQGGMGCVYAATHTQTRARAAVKVLGTTHAVDKELVSRFMQEARIASEIHHPNIIEVLDFVDQDKPRRVACVMELIEGPPLGTVLASGPLSFVQAMNIAIQLAHALHAVHAVGVIHRDLKPANIMVVAPLSSEMDQIPAVKILDFGIAKATQDTPEHRTRTGLVLGTPQYMAPEQIMAEPVSPTTDLYALGEILYEMLSGQRMFQGNNAIVFRSKVLGAPPQIVLPPSVFGGDQLAGLIRATLAHQPTARPPLADFRAALVDLLEEFQKSRGVKKTVKQRAPSVEDEAATHVDPSAIVESRAPSKRGRGVSRTNLRVERDDEPRSRPTIESHPAIDASTFGEGDTLRSKLDEVTTPLPTTAPDLPSVNEPTDGGDFQQPLNTGFFQAVIEAEFSTPEEENEAGPSPMDPEPEPAPAKVLEPEVYSSRRPSSRGSDARRDTLRPMQPIRVVSQSNAPAVPQKIFPPTFSPSVPQERMLAIGTPVAPPPAVFVHDNTPFMPAPVPLVPEATLSPSVGRGRRSRLMTAAVIAAIASSIVALAITFVPALHDRASSVMVKGVGQMGTGSGATPKANPLATDIDHWRVTHTQDARSLDEHLEAAKKASAEDAWRASEAAEVETKLALFLDPNNARALSMYVENRVLWRDELLSVEERRQLEDTIAFASAKAPDLPDVLRALAAVARMRGELPRCVTLCEQALEKDPHDARARLDLARCLVDTDPARALKEAEAVRVANPDLREATRLVARAYASSGRYGSALKLLDGLDKGRTNARALRLRGDLERELGRNEDAEKSYQLAVTVEQDNPQPRLALAATQLDLGKHKSASMIFKLVTINRMAPPSMKGSAHAGAARAQRAMGELDKAIESADAAIAASPSHAGAHLVRAELALEKGDLAKAKEHVERAIALERNAPAPLALRGRIRIAEKRIPEGLADLEVALKANPSDLRLRGMFAAAAFAAGSIGAALGALEEAQKMDPSGLYADELDENLDLELATVKGVVKQLERSSQSGEHARDAQAALGMMHYHLGNRQEASGAFSRAMTATTGVERLALAYDAQLAFEGGALAQAERTAATLAKKDPTSAVAQLLLARVYAKRGNANAAREAYKTALARNPEMIAATAELAAAQLQGGTKDVAIIALAELYKAHPKVVRVRRLLADAGY